MNNKHMTLSLKTAIITGGKFIVKNAFYECSTLSNIEILSGDLYIYT